MTGEFRLLPVNKNRRDLYFRSGSSSTVVVGYLEKSSNPHVDWLVYRKEHYKLAKDFQAIYTQELRLRCFGMLETMGLLINWAVSPIRLIFGRLTAGKNGALFSTRRR